MASMAEDAAQKKRDSMAFIEEPVLKAMVTPHNLNNGKLQDIYQQQYDDFDAPYQLEISYSDGRMGVVREIVFVDPVYEDRRPRMCVAVEGVQAMHNAIAVLSRKVDNLVMTLRECRSRYYQELVSLREQLHQLQQVKDLSDKDQFKRMESMSTTPALPTFDPRDFTEQQTEELIERRVNEATHEYKVRLQKKQEECQRLEKRVRMFERDVGTIDNPRTRVEKLLTMVSIDNLLYIMRSAVADTDEEMYTSTLVKILSELKGVSIEDCILEHSEKEEKAKAFIQQINEEKQRCAALQAQLNDAHEKSRKEKHDVNAEKNRLLEKLEATEEEFGDLRTRTNKIRDDKKKLEDIIETMQAKFDDRIAMERARVHEMEERVKKLTNDKRNAGHNTGMRVENLTADDLTPLIFDKFTKHGTVELAVDIGNTLTPSELDSLVVRLQGGSTKAEDSQQPSQFTGIASMKKNDPREVLAALPKDDAVKVLGEHFTKMDKEHLTAILPLIPESARKSVVVGSLSNLAAQGGDDTSSDDEQSSATSADQTPLDPGLKTSFDPGKDLSKKVRVGLIARLFKALKGTEVKSVSTNLPKNSRKNLFLSIYEQLNPDELKKGAELILKKESVEAFISGLSPSVHDLFFSKLINLMSKEDVEALTEVRIGSKRRPDLNKSASNISNIEPRSSTRPRLDAEGRLMIKTALVQTDLAGADIVVRGGSPDDRDSNVGDDQGESSEKVNMGFGSRTPRGTESRDKSASQLSEASPVFGRSVSKQSEGQGFGRSVSSEGQGFGRSVSQLSEGPDRSRKRTASGESWNGLDEDEEAASPSASPSGRAKKKAITLAVPKEKDREHHDRPELRSAKSDNFLLGQGSRPASRAEAVKVSEIAVQTEIGVTKGDAHHKKSRLVLDREFPILAIDVESELQDLCQEYLKGCVQMEEEANQPVADLDWAEFDDPDVSEPNSDVDALFDIVTRESEAPKKTEKKRSSTGGSSASQGGGKRGSSKGSNIPKGKEDEIKGSQNTEGKDSKGAEGVPPSGPSSSSTDAFNEDLVMASNVPAPEGPQAAELPRDDNKRRSDSKRASPTIVIQNQEGPPEIDVPRDDNKERSDSKRAPPTIVIQNQEVAPEIAVGDDGDGVATPDVLESASVEDHDDMEALPSTASAMGSPRGNKWSRKSWLQATQATKADVVQLRTLAAKARHGLVTLCGTVDKTFSGVRGRLTELEKSLSENPADLALRASVENVREHLKMLLRLRNSALQSIVAQSESAFIMDPDDEQAWRLCNEARTRLSANTADTANHLQDWMQKAETKVQAHPEDAQAARHLVGLRAELLSARSQRTAVLADQFAQAEATLRRDPYDAEAQTTSSKAGALFVQSGRQLMASLIPTIAAVDSINESRDSLVEDARRSNFKFPLELDLSRHEVTIAEQAVEDAEKAFAKAKGNKLLQRAVMAAKTQLIDAVQQQMAVFQAAIMQQEMFRLLDPRDVATRSAALEAKVQYAQELRRYIDTWRFEIGSVEKELLERPGDLMMQTEGQKRRQEMKCLVKEYLMSMNGVIMDAEASALSGCASKQAGQAAGNAQNEIFSVTEALVASLERGVLQAEEGREKNPDDSHFSTATSGLAASLNIGFDKLVHTSRAQKSQLFANLLIDPSENLDYELECAEDQLQSFVSKFTDHLHRQESKLKVLIQRSVEEMRARPNDIKVRSKCSEYKMDLELVRRLLAQVKLAANQKPDDIDVHATLVEMLSDVSTTLEEEPRNAHAKAVLEKTKGEFADIFERFPQAMPNNLKPALLSRGTDREEDDATDQHLSDILRILAQDSDSEEDVEVKQEVFKAKRNLKAADVAKAEVQASLAKVGDALGKPILIEEDISLDRLIQELAKAEIALEDESSSGTSNNALKQELFKAKTNLAKADAAKAEAQACLVKAEDNMGKKSDRVDEMPHKRISTKLARLEASVVKDADDEVLKNELSKVKSNLEKADVAKAVAKADIIKIESMIGKAADKEDDIDIEEDISIERLASKLAEIEAACVDDHGNEEMTRTLSNVKINLANANTAQVQAQAGLMNAERSLLAKTNATHIGAQTGLTKAKRKLPAKADDSRVGVQTEFKKMGADSHAKAGAVATEGQGVLHVERNAHTTMEPAAVQSKQFLDDQLAKAEAALANDVDNEEARFQLIKMKKKLEKADAASANAETALARVEEALGISNDSAHEPSQESMAAKLAKVEAALANEPGNEQLRNDFIQAQTMLDKADVAKLEAQACLQKVEGAIIENSDVAHKQSVPGVAPRGGIKQKLAEDERLNTERLPSELAKAEAVLALDPSNEEATYELNKAKINWEKADAAKTNAQTTLAKVEDALGISTDSANGNSRESTAAKLARVEAALAKGTTEVYEQATLEQVKTNFKKAQKMFEKADVAQFQAQASLRKFKNAIIDNPDNEEPSSASRGKFETALIENSDKEEASSKDRLKLAKAEAALAKDPNNEEAKRQVVKAKNKLVKADADAADLMVRQISGISGVSGNTLVKTKAANPKQRISNKVSADREKIAKAKELVGKAIATFSKNPTNPVAKHLMSKAQANLAKVEAKTAKHEAMLALEESPGSTAAAETLNNALSSAARASVILNAAEVALMEETLKDPVNSNDDFDDDLIDGLSESSLSSFEDEMDILAVTSTHNEIGWDSAVNELVTGGEKRRTTGPRASIARKGRSTAGSIAIGAASALAIGAASAAAARGRFGDNSNVIGAMQISPVKKESGAEGLSIGPAFAASNRGGAPGPLTIDASPPVTAASAFAPAVRNVFGALKYRNHLLGRTAVIREKAAQRTAAAMSTINLGGEASEVSEQPEAPPSIGKPLVPNMPVPQQTPRRPGNIFSLAMPQLANESKPEGQPQGQSQGNINKQMVLPKLPQVPRLAQAQMDEELDLGAKGATLGISSVKKVAHKIMQINSLKNPKRRETELLPQSKKLGEAETVSATAAKAKVEESKRQHQEQIDKIGFAPMQDAASGLAKVGAQIREQELNVDVSSGDAERKQRADEWRKALAPVKQKEERIHGGLKTGDSQFFGKKNRDTLDGSLASLVPVDTWAKQRTGSITASSSSKTSNKTSPQVASPPGESKDGKQASQGNLAEQLAERIRLARRTLHNDVTEDESDAPEAARRLAPPLESEAGFGEAPLTGRGGVRRRLSQKGEESRSQATCGGCGAVVMPETKFCRRCGQKVEKEQVQTTPPAPEKGARSSLSNVAGKVQSQLERHYGSLDQFLDTVERRAVEEEATFKEIHDSLIEAGIEAADATQLLEGIFGVGSDSFATDTSDGALANDAVRDDQKTKIDDGESQPARKMRMSTFVSNMTLHQAAVEAVGHALVDDMVRAVKGASKGPSRAGSKEPAKRFSGTAVEELGDMGLGVTDFRALTSAPLATVSASTFWAQGDLGKNLPMRANGISNRNANTILASTDPARGLEAVGLSQNSHGSHLGTGRKSPPRTSSPKTARQGRDPLEMAAMRERNGRMTGSASPPRVRSQSPKVRKLSN